MKTILIIEDNNDVRENIAEVLELSNYEAIQAEDGKKGVELALRVVPDLILCDIMMPHLDGFGVLKILHNNAKTSSIPFIFLTAKTEKTDFRRGMGLGADDYITKPFEDSELLEAIEIRLKKSDEIRSTFDKTEGGLQRFFNEALAREELEKLSSNREVRKYQKKDLIYEEGQYPKWLFFIVEGKVKSYKCNDFGKELITHIHSQGEFFGFLPLIQDSTYSENTEALEDTVVRLIPAEDFSRLLYNNRNFSAQFIKMLANEVGHMEQQLIDLAYSSVRKKVANALIGYANKLKDDQKSDQIILTNISREDLSNLAGTAKETLIRTLSDFKSEEIIEIIDNQIKILDMEKLQSMPQ